MSFHVPQQSIHQKTDNGRKTPLERRYMAWMHRECTCCVTGQIDFEAAHTGGYAEGKGGARKAHFKTCLPLIKPLHMHEEANRVTFWRTVGLPDYAQCAAKLFDIFMAGESPEAHLAAMQYRVDRSYVAALLGEIDY